MKTALRVCTVAFVACLVMTAQTQAGIGFRVSGGYTYINYSDWNDFVKDYNTMLVGVEQLDEIHWIPEFSGEVTYSVVPSLTVGLGAGIIAGKSDWSISTGLEFVDLEHKIRAFPFTLTGYFEPSLPFTFAKPHVFGGVGAYYSKVTFFFNYDPDSDAIPDYEADLTSWGFGMHGGAGLRFEVVPTVSIDIDVKGRWAKIKGYEGTTTSGDVTEDAVLIRYIEDGFHYYGVSTASESAGYQEGAVNLSGFGVMVSVVVGF